MEGKSCVHIGDGGRINKVANSGSGLVGWRAGGGSTIVEGDFCAIGAPLYECGDADNVT